MHKDTKIIIINGKGGSGKDTFVEMITKISPNTVLNASSIEPVKDASVILGRDPEDKSPKARKFLSDIKKAWVEYSEGGTQHLLEFIRVFSDSRKPYYIFLHIREPEEIQKMKRSLMGKCVTLLVKGRDDGNAQINDSDNCVNEYPYAYILDNDGSLEDLKAKAVLFLEMLKSHTYEV